MQEANAKAANQEAEAKDDILIYKTEINLIAKERQQLKCDVKVQETKLTN